MGRRKSEKISQETTPPRKVWKHVRPKKFKIADEATLERILNPPPRYPEPEFEGDAYVHGPENDSQYIFMCNEPGCNAKFTTDIGLTLHSKTHCDPNNKCNFCGLIFKTEEDLAAHCVEFHPDLEKDPDANPLQCKKCGKCSRDKHALWRHVRESHRGRRWSCSICNFAFTRPENLKQHIKTQHPPEEEKDVKHECKICGKMYRLKTSLRTHYRHQHRKEKSDTSYTCVLCKTVYDNLPAYQRHMNRHVNPKFFPCHACNVTFSNSSHLKRHKASKVHALQLKKVVRKKSTEDLFPAPVIKTVKTWNPNLTKEELVALCKTVKVKIILHKVDDENIYKSICPIEQTKKMKLKGNSKKLKKSTGGSISVSVEDEKSNDSVDHYLNCFYCEKELPDLDAVKHHEKICSMNPRNKKVNICAICNKEFDKPYALEQHSRKHSIEKPFKCSFCNSYFKKNCTKVLHEKHAHYNISRKKYQRRIYRCNYKGCHKHYNKTTDLKAHITAIHLKIRHPCKQCGRLFKTEINLRRHLSHVHAECPTLLECKPCNRTYMSRASYLFHLERNRHQRKTREYERRQNRRSPLRNNNKGNGASVADDALSSEKSSLDRSTESIPASASPELEIAKVEH